MLVFLVFSLEDSAIISLSNYILKLFKLLSCYIFLEDLFQDQYLPYSISLNANCWHEDDLYEALHISFKAFSPPNL